MRIRIVSGAATARRTGSTTRPHGARHRAKPHHDAQPPVASPRRRRWLAPALITAAVLASFGGWRLATLNSADPVDSAGSSIGNASGGAPPVLRSTVRIGTDGSLHTTERITFPAPQPSLTVSIQAPASTHFSPRIEDLRIRVDGHSERVLTGELVEGDAFTFELPPRAKSAVIDYAVMGAVVRTRPSPPGRVLVLATPLKLEAIPERTEMVEIVGTGVLNVGCVGEDGSSAPCGARNGHAWVVSRGPEDATTDLVAQVDLPTN